MPGHVYHHYVPRFFLTKWTTNNKLVRFRWVNGNLEIRESSITRLAGLEHLYALQHAPQDPQVIEREFMGPLIDEPAANVYHHMLRSAPLLSDFQRGAWTRFLMSLRIRIPEVIEQLRTEAERELRRQLLRQPEEEDSGRGMNTPANLHGLVEQRHPGFIADFGIRILPQLLDHQPVFNKIYEMYWWTHDFNNASVDLLTSDRPLIVAPGLDHERCVMALPLTPRLAFFAVHDRAMADRIASTPQSRLARWLNRETVRLAFGNVYAANRNQESFICRHFQPAAPASAE